MEPNTIRRIRHPLALRIKAFFVKMIAPLVVLFILLGTLYNNHIAYYKAGFGSFVYNNIWYNYNGQHTAPVLILSNGHVILNSHNDWPLKGCHVQCYIDTHERDYRAVRYASAIIYHGRDLSLMTENEHALRVYIGSTLDTNEHELLESFNKSGTVYDIILTDKADSYLPLSNTPHSRLSYDFIRFTYAIGLLSDYFHQTPMFSERNGLTHRGQMAIVVSSCKEIGYNKLSWILDLEMFGITIHTLGNCGTKLSSYDIAASGCSGFSGERQKICIQMHYKFTIVFEDTISESLVTSDFYTSLISGSIPVYIGASDVINFAPTYGTESKSVIVASDYESVRELAMHMHTVSASANRWTEYVKWKQLEPTKHFAWVIGNSVYSDLLKCTLCETVAILRDRGSDYITNRRNTNLNHLGMSESGNIFSPKGDF